MQFLIPTSGLNIAIFNPQLNTDLGYLFNPIRCEPNVRIIFLISIAVNQILIPRLKIKYSNI